VKKVLFLSSANSARSQMAEGFVRALAADAFEADSAGSAPRQVDTLTVAVMAERGIDIGEQRPKGLQEFMGTAQFDYLITVCDRVEKDCPMFPGKGAREYWPLDDPARGEADGEERLTAFREVRDQIEARVRRWLVERRYKPVLELGGRGAAADRGRLASGEGA
jgi:arsenate reductase (thioredoxin)